jgi:hypothetical protein
MNNVCKKKETAIVIHFHIIKGGILILKKRELEHTRRLCIRIRFVRGLGQLGAKEGASARKEGGGRLCSIPLKDGEQNIQCGQGEHTASIL